MQNRLPIGVQDYLGDECHNKGLIEQRLDSVFRAWGYQKIEPAALEYFDSCSGIFGGIEQTKMFKMTDFDGKLLVLRPDPTIQLSRIVTSKLFSQKINRLYYMTNSYEFDAKHESARDREFCQAGVELFGDDKVDADIEVLLLAIESTRRLGIDDFIIQLGHIDYFYGIAAGLKLAEVEQEKLRQLVSIKDMVGMHEMLKSKGISEEDIRPLSELPFMFGGSEVFSKARKFTSNPVAIAAVDRLNKIFDKLKALGYENNISIDLSMVKNNNYYTGIVFCGITQSLGQPFLDGGRYNNLCKNYNSDIPAIGFAFGLKRLLIILEKKAKIVAAPAPEYAYYGQIDLKQYNYLQRLRESGKNIVRLDAPNIIKAKEMCKVLKIGALIEFSDAEPQIIKTEKYDV